MTHPQTPRRCEQPRPDALDAKREGRGGGFKEFDKAELEESRRRRRQYQEDDDEYDDFGRKKKKKM